MHKIVSNRNRRIISLSEMGTGQIGIIIDSTDGLVNRHIMRTVDGWICLDKPSVVLVNTGNCLAPNRVELYQKGDILELEVGI